MTIHTAVDNGAAKCGSNVYRHFEMIGDKWTFIEKRVSRRRLLYFATPENGLTANCRRCLNTANRPTVAKIDEDMTGKLFHRSYGYDMTINVFCRVIGRTAKSLIVQETDNVISGDPWSPGASGKASPSQNFAKDSKPFKMFRKNSSYGGTYWTGGGEHWTECAQDAAYYENHCD